MFAVVLALVLTQASAPAPAEPSKTPEWATLPKEEPAPAPSASNTTAKLTPSTWTRVTLAGLAGVAGAGAALGIELLVTINNPGLDLLFGTTALSALLLAGGSFWVHSLLGGRGEILLAALISGALMAGAAGIASAIDRASPTVAILTVAIGSVPAAVSVVTALELTQGKPRPRAVVAPMAVPAGGGLQILGSF